MNELVVIFGMGIVAGMAVGILVMICYAAYRIKVVMNQLDQYIDEAIDTTLVGVTVEHYDGMYRLYQANTNQFICQGATLAYDFSIGTSNIVTFYMDKNSILNFPPSASGTLANFYMNDSSTLQIPSTSTIYAYMKRNGQGYQYEQQLINALGLKYLPRVNPWTAI